MEIVYDIKANTDNATKGINEVADAEKKLEKQTEDANKSLKKQEKGASGLSKAFKSTATGVKAFGASLKAVGIGLIIGAVAKLTELLSENQKVVDFVSKAFNTLTIVFNQFTKPIITVVESVASAGENFDALGRVIKNIITIALTPLKVAFKTIQGAIIGAQLAWEQSWFGDDDPEKIKRLQGELLQVKDDIVEIGKEAIESGKQIGKDFGEAFEEAGNIFSKVKDAIVEGYNEIDLQAATTTANEIVNSQTRLKQLEIEQTRIKEFYDAEAERLRQIRDDERLTFEERREANERLLEILKQNREEQLATVNERIAILQREQEQLGFNQERENEILALKAERFAIDAEYEGYKSEQVANLIALENEEKEAIKEKAEVAKKAIEDERKAADEAAKAEMERTKAIQDARIGLANTTASVAAGISQLVGEQSKASKAASIAEVLFSQGAALASALRNSQSPTPDNILSGGLAGIAKFGVIAASIATTIGRVRSIINSAPQVEGFSAPSFGGGGGSFSVGGGSGFTPLTPSIVSPTPIQDVNVVNPQSGVRAYVVESDITNSQTLTKTLNRRSRL